MDSRMPEQEIDLLKFLFYFWQKRWRILLGSVFLTLLLNSIFLFVDNLYKSTATLLPPKVASTPISNILGGVLGGAAAQPDLARLTSIFLSQALAENVYEKNQNALNEMYFPKLWDAKQNQWKDSKNKNPSKKLGAKKILKDFSVTDDGAMVTIEYVSKDAELAKVVLDTYISEARNLVNSFRIEEAKNTSKNSQDVMEFVKNNYIEQLQKIQKQFYKFEDDGSGQPDRALLEFYSQKKLIDAQVLAGMEQNLQMAKTSEFNGDVGFLVLDEPYTPTSEYFPNYKLTVPLSLVFFSFVMGGAYLILYLFNLNNSNWESLKKRESHA